MNEDNNLTMIDQQSMLNAFAVLHTNSYKPKEVVKEFWKKYSCLKAARNVYETFHLLNCREYESFAGKEQLHTFLDDLMAMFVSEYYVQLNVAVPKISYRPKS